MVGSALQSEALAPPSGPYSIAYKVRVPGADLVFVSGQVSESTVQTCVGCGDIMAQAKQALTNLRSALEAAGATMFDVAKVTVFLRNMEDRQALAQVRQLFFGDHRPASTLIEVSKLAHPEWLVEIDAIAVVERRDAGNS